MEESERDLLHEASYINVLLVDDEDALLASVRRMLQKQCLLKTCNSPLAAISLLKESPDLYDVIISDLVMPEMNGVDFLAEAKSIAPETQRILLSGSLSEERLKAAINKAGISRVLTKPVPASIILSTARDVVADNASPTSVSNRMAQRVRASLRDDHTIVFQPRVNAQDFHVTGLEALSRFPKLQQSFTTEEIITAAENHPVIGDLAFRVLEWVGSYQDSILNQYGSVPVSINISPYSVSDTNFVTSLVDMLAKRRSPLPLEFEVTEQSNMAFTAEFQKNLPRLRAAGYDVFLDDFGSGNNSIALLRRGVFSGLKIDKSLIASLDDHNAVDSSFVEWVTKVAHQLEMKVIAEGIETLDAATFLRHVGVDELQGYYFGKPAPLIPATDRE